MHWTVPELLALPADHYAALIEWAIETEQLERRDAWPSPEL